MSLIVDPVEVRHLMSGFFCISKRWRLFGQALALLMFGLTSVAAQAAEVTLAWEEIREPDAASYRIYHRESGGRYEYLEPVWEGTATSCTLTGLADGESHYFVGRSVDFFGNQSADSGEIVFHAPARESEVPTLPPDAPPAVPDPQPEPPQPPTDDPRILYDADLVGQIGTHWTVLDDDPPGAYAETSYDAVRQSNVTDLVGNWINNSFQLSRFDGERLTDTGRLIAGAGPWRLTWDMKGDLYFFVSVVLQTSAGEKTLYYTPSNFDLLGQGPFIHYGLGLGSVDGRWHTHERHLDADLWDAQPGVSLEGIQAFHIRGRVQVDDIFLDTIP